MRRKVVVNSKESTTSATGDQRQKSKSVASASYGTALSKYASGRGIASLRAPGLPHLKDNSALMRHVCALGDTEAKLERTTESQPDGKKKTVNILTPSRLLREVVEDALRSTSFSLQVEIGPHRYKEAEFVPGHIWGELDVVGPRPADVMVINKMPWTAELHNRRCFRGEDGTVLLDTFREVRAPGVSKYYVTNLIKFVPPDWKTRVKASWLSDCMYLLHHELKIVQPKYILCLGSDVSKALFGSKAGVTDMEGKVLDFEYSAGLAPGQTGEAYARTAQAMVAVHPKQVLRDRPSQHQLSRSLFRFGRLTSGYEIGKDEEVDHRHIYSEGELSDLLIEVEGCKDKKDNVIAVDAEWHGDHPINAGSYIRTIQFAWLPKHAAGVCLFKPGGGVVSGFMAADNPTRLSERTIHLLRTFFLGGSYETEDGEVVKFRRKRVVGHFFNADLEWFVDYLGLDIREAYHCKTSDLQIKSRKNRVCRKYLDEGFQVGDTVPAWYRTRHEGGGDTGFMAHAIEETASFRLETLAMRYTTAPRYDGDLQDWKTAYCKEKGISAKNMGGYGDCPDSVLLPYGIYDADVTLRLFYALDVLLEEDYEQNNCREAYWETHITSPAILDIHRTGITVDKDRVDKLTLVYVAAKESLEQSIREEIGWPEFNIRSVQHVKEFLFGTDLNGKLDKDTGKPIRIRPIGARSLKLSPVIDTSKPPKLWSKIVEQGKVSEHSPSTGKSVLEILKRSVEDPVKQKLVSDILDYRYIDQVLKSVLRSPEMDNATQEFQFDDDGYLEYVDGLAGLACVDGKVRATMYPTKETGRWSCARPNLMAISKKREADYARILGEHYLYALRSCLKASDGFVLVEADYIGAELLGMAVMAGDETMIDHVLRNQLDESDPDFYDVHSNVAKLAFGLACPPTKSGLKAIGKSPLRIVAKSVIFGIAYGRGAKAIAMEAREQGINITKDDAQKIIDTIFEMYPRLQPFFDECCMRAAGTYENPTTKEKPNGNFICSCFGRFRRFPSSEGDESKAAEFGRQAMNFPMQSMVASAVDRAVSELHKYSRNFYDKNGEVMFRILLTIHDAILFEVSIKHVKKFCSKVLPRLMRESVDIWPTSLEGVPTGDGPYQFGLDAEVMINWGEILTYDQAKDLGLPTGREGQLGCFVTYSQSK